MDRRSFLKATTGGIAITGVQVAASASSHESLSGVNARQYEAFVTEIDSESYLSVFDKRTGAVKVDGVDEYEELGGAQIKDIKNVKNESKITKEPSDTGEFNFSEGTKNTQYQFKRINSQAKQFVLTESKQVEAAAERLANAPEIIERTEGYVRKKEGDKHCQNDCIYHWVDGVSMEFNSLVANVSQAVIVAAVLAAISASGSGALAAFLGNTFVESVIGTVASDLAGNSLTVGKYHYDINYYFGSKKMKAGGYGVGPWKPGKSGLIEIMTSPGHGPRCDYDW